MAIWIWTGLLVNVLFKHIIIMIVYIEIKFMFA